MMLIRLAAMAAAALSLSLCACGALDPLLLPNQNKPYIYSPQEKLPRVGSHGYQVGATGQVSYCSQEGNIPLLNSRRKGALNAIAQVCGGEDQYRIQGEIQDRTALGGGACQRGTSIVFKCLGPEPKYDRTK